MRTKDNAPDGLVFYKLPSGEYTWLEPDLSEERVELTERGARALALDAVFGTAPTVAEAHA